VLLPGRAAAPHPTHRFRRDDEITLGTGPAPPRIDGCTAPYPLAGSHRTKARNELDFLYTPSCDVPRDMADLVDALGARVVFAIEDGGIQAVLLDLTDGPPQILLTSHVEGERPIHVYRVADLAATVNALRERGWTPSRTLEIPQGPCASFRSPGGHRIAIYELVRPNVMEHFAGRRDF